MIYKLNLSAAFYRSLVGVITLLLGLPGFAQLNYSDFEKQLHPFCGPADTQKVVANVQLLDSIRHFPLESGRELMIYDHGMAHWNRYRMFNEQEDLELAIESSLLCWKEYQDLQALSNLGILFKEKGDPGAALEYMEQYVLEAKKRKVDINYKQLYYRSKNMLRDCLSD